MSEAEKACRKSDRAGPDATRVLVMSPIPLCLDGPSPERAACPKPPTQSAARTNQARLDDWVAPPSTEYLTPEASRQGLFQTVLPRWILASLTQTKPLPKLADEASNISPGGLAYWSIDDPSLVLPSSETADILHSPLCHTTPVLLLYVTCKLLLLKVMCSIGVGYGYLGSQHLNTQTRRVLSHCHLPLEL